MQPIMEGWRSWLQEQKVNKGNVLEGIVAAALGAMFEKGADITARKSHGGVITAADVLSMIGNLSGGQELVEYSNTLVSNDVLKIAVELKQVEIQELLQIPTSGEMQARYANELELSRKYANEKRFRKFANRIATGEAYRTDAETSFDTIEIRAMGKTGQGSTTADVQILVNGSAPPDFGPGISLKGWSKQFGQAVVTMSGTGKEAENFKKGLDKDVGLLKKLAPSEYDKFKNNVAGLMAPISAGKAVSELSRDEVYAAADAAIKSSGVAGDLAEWIGLVRDELSMFLNAIADASNKDPQAFADAAQPLIRGAVGDVEFAQMARGLSRGRMEPMPAALQRLASDGGEFGVKKGAAGEVSLMLAGEALLSFRFRRDASRGKSGYKLMLRLLVQSTPALKSLMAFGGARK